MKFFKKSLEKRTLPLAGNPTQAAEFLNWAEQEAVHSAHALLKEPDGKALLAAIGGNSPYLNGLIKRYPEALAFVLENGFDAAIKNTLQKIEAMPFTATKAEIMTELRHTKNAAALIIALADIYAFWPLETVTQYLTELAEKALVLCTNHLLHTAGKEGNLRLKNEENPSDGSGLSVLSVGKMGSGELNYSSDIDLIFFYDDEKVQYTGRTTVGQFFVRLVQEMTQMIQERTKEGYVFRVDLRLRPDPGSTPAAMSVKAAEYYYETVGQNWERAAMIKARPVAGDKETGEYITQFLGRYIWRKYLDFASIEDIHSIKRQISSKVGKLPEGLLGYNVKLGHGGIREIEFYAQTQQLIWGGRETTLRVMPTCIALEKLTEIGKTTKQAADELSEAYRFYRTVEHRLQMVDDKQTHTLPETTEGMEKFAIFMGFKEKDAFIKTMQRYISTVQKHYSKLFESSPSLASDEVDGSLVFTGVEDDPETIETLRGMGFGNPSAISETIRGWHHGRRRSTRTKRAREMLTELMPVLLKSLSKTASPDIAFTRFDEFLSRLPAGVQIFSLFYAQPHLLDLVAEIMGGYPYVAENLSRKPALIEYVLSQEFFSDIPDTSTLRERFTLALKQARDYQDVLDIARAWTHDRQFRVGVQFIKKQISAEDASQHLSDIADAVLSILLEQVMKDFAKQHGKVSKNCFAIIAMGKLGGSEITFASDLDLVFVYNPDEYPKEYSELSASEYFIRLSRRFISAITAMTPEGKLYEVDTRLRPSGNDGPVACSLNAFDNYYGSANTENKAWEWEYMALTRARIIAGGKSLTKEIESIVQKKLHQHRDVSLLAHRVVEMRERIWDGKKTENPFRIKHIRGGLIDLEFIAQFLQLHHAEEHPETLNQNTRKVFENMVAAKVLDEASGKTLIEAYDLYHPLQSILRLTGNKDPKLEGMSQATQQLISQATGKKDCKILKKTLEASQKKVHNLFDTLIAQHRT